MARVKPPRAAFLDFPLGHQCGKPHDAALQTSILMNTLNILTTASAPGEIVDLPHEWGEPFDWDSYQRDMREMLDQEATELQKWAPDE